MIRDSLMFPGAEGSPQLPWDQTSPRERLSLTAESDQALTAARQAAFPPVPSPPDRDGAHRLPKPRVGSEWWVNG